MRVFQSSLLIFVCLLCLSFRLTRAALDSSSTDITEDVSYGAAESSGDATETDSWTSFLNPAHIIENIQNATSSLWQSLVSPKPSQSPPVDFWKTITNLEEIVEEDVHRLLKNVEAQFESLKFTDVTTAMSHIVNATAVFRGSITNTLDAKNITLDMLAEEVEAFFVAIVRDVEKIPPPDKAAGHAERTKMVDKVLDDSDLALTNLVVQFGMDEDIVATYLSTLRPHVHALVVAVGDINEQYPQLFPVLASSVAILLIPEEWILKPLLRLFGFGLRGPIKGSAAAWLQRFFWGARVEAGSWFSWLQAAGMAAAAK